MTFPRKFRPAFEHLGDRTLPSVTLSNGLLSVVGTAGNDVIRVTASVAGQVQVTVSSTGESRAFSASQVSGIDVRCGGGDDRVVIGERVSAGAVVSGGAGNDSITGGSGDDTINGSTGNDLCVGRGGDDRINGGDGSDDCRGGSGDDSLDGGRGRDSCRGGSGNNDVRGGFDPDTELLAVFTGGQGKAEFKFGPEDGGIDREFEVEIEDLAANTNYGVFVGNAQVATIRTNAFGDGRVEFDTDFDRDDDGSVDFPAGFPEISVGSVVTVRQANGTVVRQGTFAVVVDDNGGGGGGGSGGSGGGGGGGGGGRGRG